MFRHDFAISKCAPHHGESNSTHPKFRCAVSKCAPRHSEIDSKRPKRAEGALRAQNAHRATMRATRPAQSAQRAHFAISNCEPRHSESDSTNPKRAKGSLCDLKMCTARRPERFDPPKVRRGLTLQSPNAHHATARATRPIKVRARHEICTQAGKYCASHEICTKSSELRLSLKMSLQC